MVSIESRIDELETEIRDIHQEQISGERKRERNLLGILLSRIEGRRENGPVLENIVFQYARSMGYKVSVWK